MSKRKITLLEALDWSIQKWEWLAMGRPKEYMMLQPGYSLYLLNNCGLCEYYIGNATNQLHDGSTCPNYDKCINCDLYKLWGCACGYPGSKYRFWQACFDKLEKSTLACSILKDIRSIRDKLIAEIDTQITEYADGTTKTESITSSPISFEKAKELSIKAWEYRAETGCTRNEFEVWATTQHDLESLNSNCGICEYVNTKYGQSSWCKRCPLRLNWGIACSDINSPYQLWQATNIDGRKKDAKMILEDITYLNEDGTSMPRKETTKTPKEIFEHLNKGTVEINCGMDMLCHDCREILDVVICPLEKGSREYVRGELVKFEKETPKETKRLVLEVKTVPGWGKILRVKECLFGETFGCGFNPRRFQASNGFVLGHDLPRLPVSPENQLIRFNENTFVIVDFFTNDALVVPSEAWLDKCRQAVREYNAKFGNKVGCIVCGDIEIIE